MPTRNISVGKHNAAKWCLRLCLNAFALAFALCPFASTADTQIVDGLEWTYYVDGGKAVLGFSEEVTDEWNYTYTSHSPAIPTNTVGAVSIPSSLGGYPVKVIGEEAFENCVRITSITIPSGVTEIGDYAFAWCDRLAKVTIPASVSKIGQDAFCWSSRLTTISLASGNKSFVYSGSMLLSKNEKKIFAVSRSATSLSVPNGVETLPYGFLGGCSKLKSVTLPASVVDAVDGWWDAFGYDTCTSLTKIVVDSKNPAVKSVNNLLIYKDDPKCVAYIPAGLATVTIPASIREVDFDTAVKCENIAVDSKNRYYKSSGGCMLSKDGKTFAAAPPAMKNVTVPNGVNTIATFAFLNSNNATVTIPASVTKLGDNNSEYIVGAAVFGSCVKSIQFLGNPPLELWKNPFQCLENDWEGEIRVSRYSVQDWRDFFFANAPFLYDKVVCGIPGEPTFKYVARESYNWGDEEDGEYELDYGDGIVITGGSYIKGAIAIPEEIDGFRVTGIGRGAFKKNKNITSVKIPATVNRIGYNAFGSCTALKSVTVAGEESVDMGQFSFSGCAALADKNGFVVVNGVLYHYTGKGGVIAIPSNVRIIDDEVFRNNKTVTAVNVPGTVKIIRDEAFENCSKLTRVTIAEGCEQLGDLAFYGCPLARFNVPSTAYVYESGWASTVGYCRNLKSLTIADMDNMGWVADSMARGAKLNKACSVAFDPTGGTLDGPADERGVAHISVPYLDALWSAMPNGLFAPVRKGFVFQGWYTAKTKGSKISANTTVTKDSVTYYAQWKPKKYKVTVTAGSGGKVAKTGSYDCGSTVKFTATPNKGYVFVRWDDAEFSELHEEDYEVLWKNYSKQRRAAPLSLKIPPGDLALRAVFAKSSADAAAPVVALGGIYQSWNLETEADMEIDVWVSGSLSFAPLAAANLPPGTGLVLVDDSEEYGTHYVLKVKDASKLKPGSWNVKLSATNRSGKKSNTVSLAVVGRNTTAAIDKGAVEGLETSTLDPYVAQAGVKTSFTLATLGATTLNGWKLTKVTGMPSGWTFKDGKVSGVAAPGTYTLFYTFAKDKSTVQASSTFVVESLPGEVTGTYYGSVALYDPKLSHEFLSSRVTLTVSSAGKVSGSFADIDAKCTFSATGLVENADGYEAKVSGKFGTKSVSFTVYFPGDRSAAFDFNVGKKEYWTFNCYQQYGRSSSYGANDPVIEGLEGRQFSSYVTVEFEKGGKALVTAVYVYPANKKKFTASASAQIVRDADTGRLYLPYQVKFSTGSTDIGCFEVEYYLDDETGEITYGLSNCSPGL